MNKCGKWVYFQGIRFWIPDSFKEYSCENENVLLYKYKTEQILMERIHEEEIASGPIYFCGGNNEVYCVPANLGNLSGVRYGYEDGLKEYHLKGKNGISVLIFSEYRHYISDDIDFLDFVTGRSF